MQIGDYFQDYYSNSVARWLIRHGGMPDLHTHMRLRPMLEYLPRIPARGKELQVLEVGCGNGINLIEIARRRPARGAGYDLNQKAIDSAKSMSERMAPGRFEFQCQDVMSLGAGQLYDCVLYMDILEHLREPTRVLQALDPALPVGGHVVISVPTPRYPRVFGREMHERVGHVVEGYMIEPLSQLLPGNYRLVHHQYTTGELASWLCFLYYRPLKLVPSARLRLLAGFPLLKLHRLDWWNGPGRSCSLFAVYRKES